MTCVKICGLRRLEDIEIVNNLMPDYIGFILAPSKRRISLEEAKKLKKQLDCRIKAVGVFVNESIENILAYERAGIIDLIQLHGDEDLRYIEVLKGRTRLPLIKVIKVKNQDELDEERAQIEGLPTEFILFDTYSKDAYGGVGECFDWSCLKEIKRPYFLAGGIGLDNIEEALTLKPFGIDVSSGVETDGIKDREKIKALIGEVRKSY